jgi:hypothetical protein
MERLMNQTRTCLTLVALALMPLRAQTNFSAVPGIKDSCRAGAMLDASHVPYKVVVFHALNIQGAGCLYTLNGSKYLYSEKGSAQVSTSAVARTPLEKVPRVQVLQIADGNRDIHNGCLVDATCAFASYQHNPHIVWAGIIAAQVINVSELGAMSYHFSPIGHAITAYETDTRVIYIQENDDEPRRIDWLTDKAQRGDRSWYDSSALIFADHHIQGITTFKDQMGRPL